MKNWAYAAFIAMGIGAVASAHEGATGVVKTRMDDMKRFEELIERIYAMYGGELAYDPAAIRRAADEIRQKSGSHMTALFPKGSDFPPSEARSEIWRNFDNFERLAVMLEGWAGELAARANQPPREALPRNWEDAVMGPFMMIGGGMTRREGSEFAAWHVAATCNACHVAFRGAN